MSEMTENETLERWDHGLKKARDCAERMARLVGGVDPNTKTDWRETAKGLDILRMNGIKLFNAKQINRQDALVMVDNLVGKDIVERG